MSTAYLVGCGSHLRNQTGCTKSRTGHERPETDPLRRSGESAKKGPRLPGAALRALVVAAVEVRDERVPARRPRTIHPFRERHR